LILNELTAVSVGKITVYTAQLVRLQERCIRTATDRYQKCGWFGGSADVKHRDIPPLHERQCVRCHSRLEILPLFALGECIIITLAKLVCFQFPQWSGCITLRVYWDSFWISIWL